MSDEQLKFWVNYGESVTMDTVPLGGGLSGEVLQLWKLFAELANREIERGPQ